MRKLNKINLLKNINNIFQNTEINSNSNPQNNINLFNSTITDTSINSFVDSSINSFVDSSINTSSIEVNNLLTYNNAYLKQYINNENNINLFISYLEKRNEILNLNDEKEINIDINEVLINIDNILKKRNKTSFELNQEQNNKSINNSIINNSIINNTEEKQNNGEGVDIEEKQNNEDKEEKQNNGEGVDIEEKNDLQ